MRKVFAESKILVLVMVACVTGLLLGAGCPASDVLDPNKQPSAGTASAPTFQFTAPTARVTVTVGGVIGLSWTDSHPVGDATVRLFYDHDGSANTGDETTITMMNEAAGTTSGGYAWNTSGMPMAVYRLAATIDDHTNAPVTQYLPYEVVVREKGTGGGTDGTDLVPTLAMLQPATTLSPLAGGSILIRWNVTNPPPNVKLYLYYDTDKTNNNMNEELITVLGPGTGQIGSNDYGWTVPLNLANGTYYILARLTDGLGTDLKAYAPGSIVIGGATTTSTRDLSQMGVTFPGAIFDGYVAGGRMGEVLTGGKDFNGDSYPDFIFVAPKSHTTWDIFAPAYPGQTHLGEAYLVYARGASGRWPQGAAFSMERLGTYNDTQGVQFIGPTYSTTSSGIQEVLMIDDRDSDGRPEIIFGIPDVDRILQDQQDYDPLDSSIHDTIPPARPGSQPGFYYYKADGWQAYSDQRDGGADDWLMRDGEVRGPQPPVTPDPGKRSGMIIYVSSQGNLTNQVVLLDEVGGRRNWVRTRIARCFGMRLYPIASSDTTQWGSQLATVDLYARPVYPALLVARPEDDGGVGSVKILVQEEMAPQFQIWDEDPALSDYWNVQPKTWSFPAADSVDNNGDPDREPKWPEIPWSIFMDFPASQAAAPLPNRYAIMTSDKVTGANGHLSRPTNLKDFNRDSLEDVAVAAPDASPSGRAQAGMAYVVAGYTGLQGADVSVFSQSGASMRLAGTQAGEQLGWRMAGPGDLTGDGFSDWLLTAPNRSWAGRDRCGAVMIVPGRPMPYTAYTADEVVSQLQGAVIYGQNTDDHLGMYLAAVGDVDRDNYPDFVVSAPGYDHPEAPGVTPSVRNNCGVVYLIYGGPHLMGEFDIQDVGTAQLPGKVYVGPLADAAIGPVAAAGDTDNDFYTDFLIGYPGYNLLAANGQVATPEAGRVWLVYGSRKQAP